MTTTITSGVYETVNTWKTWTTKTNTLAIHCAGNYTKQKHGRNIRHLHMGMYWRVGFSDFIYDEIFQERGLTCLTSWHCEMEPWESNFTRRSSTRKSPFKLVNNGLYNVYIVLFGVELSFLAHNFLQATTKRIWALMATQPPVGGAAPTNRAVGSVCMWRRPSTQGTTYETSGKHGSSLGATRKRWNMVKHGETSAKMRMMRWGLKIGQSKATNLVALRVTFWHRHHGTTSSFIGHPCGGHEFGAV